MKPSFKFDGPVLSEIRTGVQRIHAEWQRMVRRVRLQLRLKRLDREEEDAVREVEYQSDSLFKAQANLAGLQAGYIHQRFELIEALRQTNHRETV